MRARTMTLALLALAAAAPVALSPALAQQAQRPFPNRIPTTWTEVNKPLSALLDEGWRIVAQTGPGLTLEQRGKYVLCQLFPAGGMSSRGETTSECRGLN